VAVSGELLSDPLLVEVEGFLLKTMRGRKIKRSYRLQAAITLYDRVRPAPKAAVQIASTGPLVIAWQTQSSLAASTSPTALAPFSTSSIPSSPPADRVAAFSSVIDASANPS